ncbi:MAG: calcium-binding protein [Elainella sp.]
MATTIRGDRTGRTADRLDGTIGDAILIGGFENDTYVVDSSNDKIVESSGSGIETVEAYVSWDLRISYDINDPSFMRLNDPSQAGLDNLTLMGAANINGTGNTLPNLIKGNSGHNRLDGREGADTLMGGLGNDTYVVDNLGDQIVDTAGTGFERVESSVSWTLGVGLEDLTLTGTATIDGTGNDLANSITGNEARNLLKGNAGDDVLRGNGGNDELRGDAGNDYLDGGTGEDLLIGGTGGTIYVIDSPNDQINDTGDDAGVASEDLVLASISFTLSPEINHLTFRGSDSLTGTGNSLANRITGNSGANLLSGLGGEDTLRGGAGADQLVGGGGNDVLNGGAGPDQFIFNASNEGIDTIQDFALGEDLLVVSKAGFTVDSNVIVKAGNPSFRLTAGQALRDNQFHVGTEAETRSQFFLYSSGVLSFDADGSGTSFQPVQIAKLANSPVLTAAQIFVTT